MHERMIACVEMCIGVGRTHHSVPSMSNTMPRSFGAPLSTTPFFKGANLRGAEEAIVDRSRRMSLALRDKLGDVGLKLKGVVLFVDLTGPLHD